MNRFEQDAEVNMINQRLEIVLPQLGKHKIERIRQGIDKYYKKRFLPKCKTPKYGSITKGFTDEELHDFLSSIEIPKYHLLFNFQATMGLRVGEAVKVNLNDINQKTRELNIWSEKRKRPDYLTITLDLYDETLSYMKTFESEIAEAQGYLFFKDNLHYSKRKEAWLEKNYVRKVFTHYIAKAKIENQDYGTSDESNGNITRTLHRLTTHSLRHYAITRFSRACNGNLELTRKFARHSRYDTTVTYIANDKTELYVMQEKAFSSKTSPLAREASQAGEQQTLTQVPLSSG